MMRIPGRPSAQLAVIIIMAGGMLVSGCSLRNSVREPLPPVTKVSRPAFRQALGATLGASWQAGNKVRPLSNGDEIFPAMLAAIRSARKTINFETYVYWKGEVPREFAEALAERARAGVTVNALFDGVGCMDARHYHRMLREAGVNLHIYHAVGLFTIHRFNYRTHRKLLIVDGRVGFIGGVGIADEWKGDARHEGEWREMHYRVEGPVVAQLQGIFADNWLDEAGEVLQGSGHFPALAKADGMDAAAFMSSPLRGRCHVELMYHLAIASAARSILITTPYFVPDRQLTRALCDASRRGVKVAVIMPGRHINSRLVRRASQRKWPALVEAGVELYEYQPTMIHSKTIVVDGLFVSVGSANFDPRSMRINDEANLNVVDRDFAARHAEIFQQDLRKCRPVKVDGGLGQQLSELPLLPLRLAEVSLEGQL